MKTKRIITNIIELDKLNKKHLCATVIDKYFRNSDYVDIAKLDFDNILTLYTIDVEWLYKYSNYDPITWLDENGYLDLVKEFMEKYPFVIGEYCPHLIEKHLDWYPWKSHGKFLILYHVDLIEKYPNKYNWEYDSDYIAMQCPYLIHKFRDLYNWEHFSFAVVYYCPWLVPKYFKYINWGNVVVTFMSNNFKSSSITFKRTLKKYLYDIDWTSVLKYIEKYGRECEFDRLNIFELVNGEFEEDVTNIIEVSKFDSELCTIKAEKYFPVKNYIDLTEIDLNTVDESDLAWVYAHSVYNPFLWLDQNGLFRIEYFEKFRSIFIKFSRCRLLLNKYLGKVAAKKRLSYEQVCKNATKLLKK